MDVGSGSQGCSWPPWIFIHGTDVGDRGLIVLFFGHFLLFFSLCYFSVFAIFRSFFLLPPLPEIFLRTPLLRYSFIHQGTSTRRQRIGDLFGFRVKLPPVSTIYPLIGRGNPVKYLAQRHNK